MTALSGCVATLKSTLDILGSSIDILDSGVSDFPRLSKVLQTTRHFELVPEHDLHQAQNALQDEIRPEVSMLLGRVGMYLERLGRREESLRAKAELQMGRLGDSAGKSGSAAAAKKKAKSMNAGGANAIKMRMLTQKKERLSYAVERLTLQAQQKERQLRMSVAAT